MRTLDVNRYALSVIIAAMLAGCGSGSNTRFSPSPAGPSTALRVTTAERTRPDVGLLYSFKGGSGDGEKPFASLINVNGTLYGTTVSGGANGDGTLFAITLSGTETVLHSFGGSGDGEHPYYAGLVNVKGILYGTTYFGGTHDRGTVFSITPSGTETVLYSFKGGSGDGEDPYAGLLNLNGKLYGMTWVGGKYGNGTVFAVTTSGKETVLHSFGGSGDGANPLARLINVNGTLYGVTYAGGANGGGTVFSITTSGTQTVVYSFLAGSGDGKNPSASLINVNGTLYGTTLDGGAYGDGTVFAITMSGTETVLHSFSGADGENPYASLINVDGKLYGTTTEGGAKSGGTVFAITTSGTETVLHSFAAMRGGGVNPYASLIKVNRRLYGTTYAGGANGHGTVFSLTL